MRTKKVQKTPFQQKLSEKLEASSERMLAKMESANEPATVETAKQGRKAKSSTRTDKQREYDRRYQAKRRAAKQAEKEQAKPELAKLAPEPIQPTPKRENVADALKDFFVRSCSAEIFKTEVEVMLNESNHYYKRLVSFYRTQAETKDAIIDEQARQLDRLNARINDMIQKQRRQET